MKALKLLTRAILVSVVFASLLMACSTTPDAITEARNYISEGRGDEALVTLDRASRANPDNYALRNEFYRQRTLLSAQWLARADTLRLSGQFDPAEELYNRVLSYDSANSRARVSLQQMATDKRHRAILDTVEKLVKAEKYQAAENALRPVLTENPNNRDALRLERRIDEKLMSPAIAAIHLNPASNKPLSLELRDVSLRNAFDVLSRASNVNFVFDKDVRADQRTTILVRDASFEDAIQMILTTNQLERKVLNPSTVLIFPNTPQKLREYQDLIVKSFYLSNADVKQTANMIRTIVKTRDIFVDEKLDLVVIKDTPAAVRLAERLIAAQDLAESEVMLEVEVMEVSWNRLMDLGLKFPDSVAWSLVGGGAAGTGGTPGVLSLTEWLNRSAGLVRLTVPDPLFLLTLRQQDGSTNLLANPRIRVKNRGKARIHIGDRVPVFTTTAAATGGFVASSVSYLDVGLKLEVEPQISLDDDISINIALEVSNIVKEVTSPGSGGTLAYQIGTRNAGTSLRLHDGETQILAGLISNEDRRTANRVPGVGDMPVLGRLFSSTSDSQTKSEIVLLITPRLMRTVARPSVRSMEFAAGTEITTGAPAGSIQPIPISSNSPPPMAPTITPAPPVVQPSPAVQGYQPQTGAPAPGMVPFGGVVPPQLSR